MADGKLIKDLSVISKASDDCDLIIEDDSPKTMRIKLGDLKDYINQEIQTQIQSINNDLSNLNIKIYTEYSDLGLSPTDTICTVFDTMPNRSLFIHGGTDFAPDSPDYQVARANGTLVIFRGDAASRGLVLNMYSVFSNESNSLYWTHILSDNGNLYLAPWSQVASVE